MIDRKLWFGDIVWLGAGNSFYFDEVVSHREGVATVRYTSEPGEALVEITDGYIVKRSDLRELDALEGKMVTGIMTLLIPEALNGVDKAERERIAADLAVSLRPQ